MSYKKRIVLIILLAIGCSVLLVWMMFHSGATRALSSTRLFDIILLGFCLTPIYPLCLRVKKHPRSSVIPFVLIGAMICFFLFVVASFILHFSGPLVTLLFELGRGFIVLAFLLSIWSAFRRKKAGKEAPLDKRVG